MNCDELQQLSALQALGLLDPPDADRLRQRLEHDPDARVELARFLDAAAAMVTAAPRVDPPPGVRARVLDQIRRRPQAKPVEGSPAEAPVPEGMQFIRSTAPWMPAPLPGARFKLLSAGPNQGHIMLLIELAPGALYPEHDHESFEEMYVLTGDLQTEGRSLGPGDFLHAEAGSHHHELRTVNGCTALMVVPREALASLSMGT